MNSDDFCLAFECPINEVSPDMIDVCRQLGDRCEHCDHRCSGVSSL